MRSMTEKLLALRLQTLSKLLQYCLWWEAFTCLLMSSKHPLTSRRKEQLAGLSFPPFLWHQLLPLPKCSFTGQATYKTFVTLHLRSFQFPQFSSELLVKPMRSSVLQSESADAYLCGLQKTTHSIY